MENIISFGSGVVACPTRLHFGKKLGSKQLQRVYDLLVLEITLCIYDDLLFVFSQQSRVTNQDIGSHLLQSCAHVDQLLELYLMTSQVARMRFITLLDCSIKSPLKTFILGLQFRLAPYSSKGLYDQLDAVNGLNLQLRRVQSDDFLECSSFTKEACSGCQLC